jgi:hemerythrin
MGFSAADLKMVDDHIAQGEHHVARQKEIIASLQSQGHPTEMAEELLTEFQATLEQHRAHRDLMLLENRAEGSPGERKG